MSAQFDDAEDDFTTTPLAATLTAPHAPPAPPPASDHTTAFARVDDPDALEQARQAAQGDQFDSQEEDEEDDEEEYWSEGDEQWDLEQGMAALNAQDWAEGSGGEALVFRPFGAGPCYRS